MAADTDDAAGPALAVDGLEKRYDGVRALDGVDVTLRPGELTVLVGRSGAGKTTLLRCMNGLETPDGGAIRHGGAPLETDDVALVFQSSALVDRKSALANVLDGALGREPAWRGVLGWRTPAEKREAIARLHDVGLAGMADRRVDRLSGGERQRVGIARALHQEPRVVLADEPVAALDPATARDVLSLLADVVHDAGLVGLLSLHQPGLASAVADRYLGLAAGRLVLDEAADAVDPADVTAVYEQTPGGDDRVGADRA
ncbi:phosphonate ABC transporter ATP-binding protein [Halarchaeum acidiphilum MH1-52-1]|uniref:Phosphonate ABC transporter ATP-binding protein n=1 Tax=Halarchaeum acidiphilum MH1-52-1 TaxID=1261545 RepID=U2YXR9_9EURY|nr:ATP-binding cassette domain-containing protein [Halarchaeum acidiphilum]GAD53607.1 phosphonate ABC transporter ATP-binding protein [Halarchaeum acidiphilum MH1-52-1]